MIFDVTLILGFLIGLILSALFSGLETAIISIDSVKLNHLSELGNPKAGSMLQLYNNKELLVSSCLIGNNLTIIFSSVMISTLLFKYALTETSWAYTAVAVETGLFLIFGEILPKAIARNHATSIVLRLFTVLQIMMILFKPLLFVINKINRKLFKNNTNSSYSISREEIESLIILGSQEGIIDNDESEIISDVFEFGNITAREIMIPTIQIISCELKKPLTQVILLSKKFSFSRIPIFSDRVDNLIGYVAARNLIQAKKTDSIEKTMEKTIYIPLTKKISELYVEMKTLNLPIVFVVNEYGAVSGMISLEDIAEEIVGEIQTLDHPNNALFSKNDDGSYTIEGVMQIEDFNKEFNVEISKHGYHTLGGYFCHRLGKIPMQGEKISRSEMDLIALEVSHTQIRKIKLLLKKKKLEN